MKLSDYLKQSNYTVVLTGAGIGREAGLPDFQSGGNIGPFSIAEFFGHLDNPDAIQNNRERFVEFFKYCIRELENYEPALSHRVLAKWERKGFVKSIITQNVDGLHQKAGSQNVIEIHGTLSKLRCGECGREYPARRYSADGGTTCICGGFLRPSVVLFNEALPEDEIKRALGEMKKAELLIILGSSLNVFPANQLPMIAKKNGAKIVYINLESRRMDKYADLTIKKEIKEVLMEADNEL